MENENVNAYIKWYIEIKQEFSNAVIQYLGKLDYNYDINPIDNMSEDYDINICGLKININLSEVLKQTRRCDLSVKETVNMLLDSKIVKYVNSIKN